MRFPFQHWACFVFSEAQSLHGRLVFLLAPCSRELGHWSLTDNNTCGHWEQTRCLGSILAVILVTVLRTKLSLILLSDWLRFAVGLYLVFYNQSNSKSEKESMQSKHFVYLLVKVWPTNTRSWPTNLSQEPSWKFLVRACYLSHKDKSCQAMAHHHIGVSATWGREFPNTWRSVPTISLFNRKKKVFPLLGEILLTSCRDRPFATKIPNKILVYSQNPFII